MKAIWIGMIGCGICLAQAPVTGDSFAPAIQARLDKEKPACVAFFDKRDPTGHLMIKGTESMMGNAKLEQYRVHGLVVRQETKLDLTNPAVLAVTGLFSRHVKAWRYDWSPAVTGDVVDDELCYGYGRSLVNVLHWTDPHKNGPVTVEYSWRYGRVADWAKQAWMEYGDPEVWAATRPVQTSTIALTLFNDGWH